MNVQLAKYEAVFDTVVAASLVPLSVRLRLALAGHGIEVSRCAELVLLIGAQVSALSALVQPWPLALALLLCIFVLQNQEWPKGESIRAFRTATSLATAVAILAVDFSHVFPTRFAKTQTEYGLSLMDLGAGAVVFGDALVPRPSVKPRRFLLFLSLALLRYAALRIFQLPEPEPEYQLGWNFFFTLAGLELPRLLFSSQTLLPLSVLAFILQSQLPPGPNTLPGYLAIHTATTFLRKIPPFPAILLAFIFLLSTDPNQASRATANPQYVGFVLAIGLLFLHLAPRVDTAWHLLPPTSILRRLDANLLLFFILANLLCGICNLSIDTSSISNHLLVLLFLFLHSGLSMLLLLRIPPKASA